WEVRRIWCNDTAGGAADAIAWDTEEIVSLPVPRSTLHSNTSPSGATGAVAGDGSNSGAGIVTLLKTTDRLDPSPPLLLLEIMVAAATAISIYPAAGKTARPLMRWSHITASLGEDSCTWKIATAGPWPPVILPPASRTPCASTSAGRGVTQWLSRCHRRSS
ncbi:hypothetical protein Vretimale_7409, partial [Volvox reticuliferus]